MGNKTLTVRNNLYRIAVIVMSVIGMFFLLQLIAGSLIYRVYITLDMREMPVYYHNSPIIILECLILLILIGVYGHIAKKIPDKWIYVFFSVLYLIAGLYLILRTEPYLHSDPYMIFKYVDRFNHGDYSGFEIGYYMNMFPYQLGFLTYERLLSVVSYDLRWFYFANLVWVLLINLSTWRISRLLFGKNEAAVKYTILLSFLFVPLLFNIFWMYGQIPGFGMLSLSFWMLVRYLKKGQPYNIVLAAVFAALSYQLKMNYMIGVIAMAIVLILCFLKRGGIKHFVCALVIVLSVMSLKAFVPKYYKQVSGYEFGVGTPYMSYLAMGLQETTEGNTRAPGWYNGYVFDLFLDNGSDADKATELSIQYMKERIPELMSNPAYTTRFFREKLTAAWCDPLFQSVWSGPIEDEGTPRTQDPILRNIYKGGRVYEIIEAFMNALNVLIFLGAALFLIRKKLSPLSSADTSSHNEDTGLEPEILFYIIYFIGGFIFHGISEAKGQYSYMYVYCLIPLSAYVVANLENQLKRIRNKK